MTIKDLSTPLTASNNNAAKNSLTKKTNQETSPSQNDINNFTQNLQQALGLTSSVSNGSATTNALSKSSFAENIKDIDLGLGLGLPTGNISSSGNNSASMLQGVINQDITKQFTELGLNISNSFLAGLKGLDSATAVASTAKELVDSAKETAEGKLAELDTKDTTKSAEKVPELKENIAKAEEIVTKAKDKSLINISIPNMQPESLLEEDDDEKQES